MQIGGGGIFGGWQPPEQKITMPPGWGNTPVQQMPIDPDSVLQPSTGATRGMALPGQTQSTPVNPFAYTRPDSRPPAGTGRGQFDPMAASRQTARPATPAQPPMPGGYNYQPPQPLGLTQSMYNWINSPGANWGVFQNQYGPDAANLWYQARNFGGDVNSLPTYDPGLGGGGATYQKYGGQMPTPQPNQMGYRPPSQNLQPLQQYMPQGGYGQGGGYNPGMYQGGGFPKSLGGYGYGGAGGYGGGMRSQYGGSGQRAINPQLIALLQQLLGGYSGNSGGSGGGMGNQPYGYMGPLSGGWETGGLNQWGLPNRIDF